MRFIRRACGPFFIVAGALHFLRPAPYERIVPPWLPARSALVYASGVAEAGGGIGLMRTSTRGPAGWWLVATLLAVFPANVHMALHPDEFRSVPGGRRLLWARLPVQGLLIWWVLASARREDCGH
jgi:uncharacterized membrane protein